MADPEPQVHQLKVALATNRVIATAVGLVMGKYRMDHEHALAHLTAKSEHTNVQLSRLALDLVSAAEGAVRRTRVSVSKHPCTHQGGPPVLCWLTLTTPTASDSQEVNLTAESP